MQSIFDARSGRGMTGPSGELKLTRLGRRTTDAGLRVGADPGRIPAARPRIGMSLEMTRILLSEW
jgi:hypothetical protein